MDVNNDAVLNAFKNNDVPIMIHGHTHRPRIHKLETQDGIFTRIVLGDWYKAGSVLEYFDADNYELKSFS